MHVRVSTSRRAHGEGAAAGGDAVPVGGADGAGRPRVERGRVTEEDEGEGEGEGECEGEEGDGNDANDEGEFGAGDGRLFVHVVAAAFIQARNIAFGCHEFDQLLHASHHAVANKTLAAAPLLATATRLMAKGYELRAWPSRPNDELERRCHLLYTRKNRSLARNLVSTRAAVQAAHVGTPGSCPYPSGMNG